MVLEGKEEAEASVVCCRKRRGGVQRGEGEGEFFSFPRRLRSVDERMLFGKAKKKASDRGACNYFSSFIVLSAR
jgi:hypothetical protein